MTKSVLAELSDAYDNSELQFLRAVRAGSERASMASFARRVADAATAFNAEASRRFHEGDEDAWMPLDQLTERTEVFAELWADLADAFAA